jgi:hypothetical protein
MGIEVTEVPQRRPNLGRQRVHDSRSLEFPTRVVVDRSKWVGRSIRIYDPKVNPNQCHGECTGVAKCIQFNAERNRVAGKILTMENAHEFYHLATMFDPFQGTWPPADTGSSGLASAKAAVKLGLGGEYQHVFGGADEVVQLIEEGLVVSCGTWWYDNMFTPNAKGIIEPTGPQVGGHQYAARAYHLKTDTVGIRCWWGEYRDVQIKREHLNELLLDGGDAHIQARVRN